LAVKNYTLKLDRDKTTLKLSLEANESGHAQAQASDICRALQANSYQLDYVETESTHISELFNKLAVNDFTYNQCFIWKGRYDKDNYPCLYVFKERLYVRNVILKYLDIPKEDAHLRLTCGKRDCVNPFHFSYAERKNERLTGGDTKMLLAYASQGVSVTQIAKAFNLHRSTIYRKLKRERFHSRS
jgi:hypothetical protein